jgi:hypothetical protein
MAVALRTGNLAVTEIPARPRDHREAGGALRLAATGDLRCCDRRHRRRVIVGRSFEQGAAKAAQASEEQVCNGEVTL